MSSAPSITELAELLQAGDRAALGRSITLVESSRTEDQARARGLLQACTPPAMPAQRIGITGIPGVGKSTLIDALGSALVQAGHRVAVLAVDPTSQRSGGSILGDKTRMERLTQLDAAFVRPSAAGTTLGGVARRTRETILLCEAAGYDRILVETVGVGQSEWEVDRMTDLNVLLMIAGAGDELQGIKRGIMESADLVVLTKVEGDQRPRAEATARDLRNAIHLLPARPSGEHPPVLLVSAQRGEGIPELAAELERRHAVAMETGLLQVRRKEQARHWMRHAVLEGLRDRLTNDPLVAARYAELEGAVQAGTLSPFDAADAVLGLFRTGDAPRP